MTEKSARSVFVPMLVVGMLLLVGLAFVTIAPVVKCPSQCIYTVKPEWNENSNGSDVSLFCATCKNIGKVPLLNIWRGETEETS